MRVLDMVAGTVLLAATVPAGHPQVASIVPRGAQRGTEVTLTIYGARLADLQGLVLFRPGIEVLAVTAERANRGRIKIRVAADCPLGTHEMLVRTARGMSNLHLFMVGVLPEVAEKEPNDTRGAAQEVPLDVTINGRITAEDVDVFAVPVKKGQRINFEVQGLRLGDREFDPHLTVHDDRGARRAMVDDTIFGQMDPLASVVCERDGLLFVTVRESARGGANNCFYRLHAGTFPRPLVAVPAGGKPGAVLTAQLIGAGEPIAAKIRLPQKTGLQEHFVRTATGTSPTPIHLVTSDRTNVFEAALVPPAAGAKASGWWLLGPFANPRDRNGKSVGHGKAFAPEAAAASAPDPEAKFTGRDGAIAWTPQPKLRENAIHDLRQLVPKSDDSVLYLARTIDAATARRVLFLCSGDDTIRVWHNGELVLDDGKPGATQTNQHRSILDLRAGRNVLLMKISNRGGACSFFSHLLDPQRLRGHALFAGPAALNGVIAADGETDRFVFLARGGEQIDFQVISRRLRSPLDPVLGCSCTHDRFYAGNDDLPGLGLDSLLRFRAPFTGEFVLSVRDMLLTGGPGHVYRVEASPPQARPLAVRTTLPGYRDEWTVSVPAGGRDAIMIATTNLDQNAGVKLEFDGLPTGVSATLPAFIRGVTSIPVVFRAAAGTALSGNLLAVRATATRTEGDLSNAVFHQPVEIVQSRNQRTYLETPIDRLPVAVTEPSPFTIDVAPVRVPLVRGSPIQVPFTITREKGYAQAVRVRMLYNPPGISSGQVAVAGTANAGVMTLYANGGTRIGVHQIVLVGMGAVRGAPLSSSSELVDLEVTAPWLTATLGSVRSEPGTKVTLPVTFSASKEFGGKIATEWIGLPRGVTCAPFAVERSTAKLDLPLTIDAQAPPGRHRSFRLRLKIQTGNGWVVHDFRSGEIRIDRPAAPSPKRTGS